MLRRSLLKPIDAIFAAAAILEEAAARHLEGDFEEAERLFKEANDPEVWRYTADAWGQGSKERYGFISVAGAWPHLPVASRPQPRMPRADVRREVIIRDGYHCRFCGIPVIHDFIRRRLAVRYPEAVGWGKENNSQHAAFQCMWLQFDHLLPNSRGGESTVDNIVVACAPCNYGRMQTTLEEAQLEDPLKGDPPIAWDGHGSWKGLEQLRAYL